MSRTQVRWLHKTLRGFRLEFGKDETRQVNYVTSDMSSSYMLNKARHRRKSGDANGMQIGFIAEDVTINPVFQDIVVYEYKNKHEMSVELTEFINERIRRLITPGICSLDPHLSVGFIPSYMVVQYTCNFNWVGNRVIVNEVVDFNLHLMKCLRADKCNIRFSRDAKQTTVQMTIPWE